MRARIRERAKHRALVMEEQVVERVSMMIQVSTHPFGV
jgi:hypothetical protein